MDVTLWIELAIFALLMAMSGFFSSSETSLFSLNARQLEQMRRDDHPSVGLIEKLLSAPRRLIVTILIGNEFVNVAASVISAAIIIKLFGAENKLINLFVMVPILLLVGEITPKTLAIRNNVAFAVVQSRPIDLFAQMITPLRWLIRLVADWFTTLIVGKERSPGSIVTEDMVRTLAQEAVGDGVLDQSEAQYIGQIFDFGKKTLKDIATARPNIVFLPLEMPLPEVVGEFRRTRHSKMPVYRGHRDEVVGILHSRDLLGADLEELGDRPGAVMNLLREPYFVPETKLASELFRVFRKRKLSLAITVDEYGGVTGLVTMEDLLECIFGDLPSASDRVESVAVKELADGRRQIDGGMTIDQFNCEFGGRLETEEFDTIGGLLLHSYGELPPQGTDLTVGDFEFSIVGIENTRVGTVNVGTTDAVPDTAEQDSGAPDPAERDDSEDPSR